MGSKKSPYQNPRTREVREIDVSPDDSGHFPMYVYLDGDEWKAVPKWGLKVINSSEFFASAHEPRVRFTKPPLEGSDFPYGVT